MFRDVPVEYWPSIGMHIDYPVVFRATMSVDLLSETDFLPTHIERDISKKVFKHLGDYSMSVFSDLDKLKETINQYDGLKKRIKSFSQGFTTINRGVSLHEDEKTHINYFLYDYIKNNPKDDFVIIEVVENENG